MRTKEQREIENAWENEGGPTAPRKGWVVNREYHERIVDSIFEIDFAELEKRVLAMMFGGVCGFAGGGVVRDLNRYPYYMGGTRTGRWPGLRAGEVPAVLSQAMSKGTLAHKELEEQLRGPSWWKRFTAWLSKLYNPLWCI